MAIIKPFKGIRPPQNLVEQVASRPYDVLNSEEAREEAAGNENLFTTLSSRKLIFRRAPTSTMTVCMPKLQRIFNYSKTKDGWYRTKRNYTTSMHKP